MKIKQEKVKHLFRANDELWKQIRMHCINKGIDVNDAMTELIKKGLEESSDGKRNNNSPA